MFNGLKRLLGLSIAVRLAVSHDDLLKVIAWFNSNDTGMSSRTLAAHLAGASLVLSPTRGGEDTRIQPPSYPYDNGDLGRCIRFLRFMGWEDRIKEMRGVSPEWTALVKRWDELTKLYDEQTVYEREHGYTRPPRVLRRNASAEARARYEAQLELYNKNPSSRLYQLMKEIEASARARRNTKKANPRAVRELKRRSKRKAA